MFVSSFYEVELLWLWALVENDRLQKYVNGSITNSIIFITNIIPVSTESQLFYSVQYFFFFYLTKKNTVHIIHDCVFICIIFNCWCVCCKTRGLHLQKKKKNHWTHLLFRFCHQCQNYFSQNNSEELILFAFSFHIIRWYIAATILRALLSVLVRSLGFVAVCAGDSQPMDVCSVHHNNSFLRYSVSLLGYGFYGDVLTDSERKRWMGPARYDLSGSSLGHWKGNLPPFIATFNTVPATLELRVGKKERFLD